MGAIFGKQEHKSKSSASQSKQAPAAKPAPAANQVNDKDRAILDLKNARDRLKKFRKKLDVDSAKLQEQAKTLIQQKQKERALLVLKMKRFKEKELNNVDGQLISILEMIENVEWAAANLEVMKALKAGTNALNKIHEEMSVDDVAALLDETNEAIEVENQINEMLAGQLNLIDDAELEKELAELMGTNVEVEAKPTAVQLPEVPTSPVFPAIPSTPVSSREVEVEVEGVERKPIAA